LILALASSGPAWSQALDPGPGGAAGVALAGAGAVGLRSPAALFINPALIPLAESRVLLGFSLEQSGRVVIRTAAVNEALEARDLSGVAALPEVALALPVGWPWLWFSLGYHRALGVESHYGPERSDAAAPARYRGLELELAAHVWSCALAIRIRDRFALGAAVELRHLRLRHRQAIWAGFAIDHLEDSRLDLAATVEGSAPLVASGLLGLWLRPARALELGLALSLPTTAHLDGELALEHEGNGAPYGYTSLSGRSGAASISLPLPLALRGGIGISLWRLRLLLEAGFERWSSAGDLSARSEGAGVGLVRSGGGVSFHPISELPLGIRLGDRASAHAGLELLAARGLLLRAGYGFVHGASQPEAPSSVLLDLDHHTWGLGLELARGGFRFGLSFAHTVQASLEASGEQARLFNPLRPELTQVVGLGRYLVSRTRVALEVQWGW
jgi:hypothetical protein